MADTMLSAPVLCGARNIDHNNAASSENVPIQVLRSGNSDEVELRPRTRQPAQPASPSTREGEQQL